MIYIPHYCAWVRHKSPSQQSCHFSCTTQCHTDSGTAEKKKTTLQSITPLSGVYLCSTQTYYQASQIHCPAQVATGLNFVHSQHWEVEDLTSAWQVIHLGKDVLWSNVSWHNCKSSGGLSSGFTRSLWVLHENMQENPPACMDMHYFKIVLCNWKLEINIARDLWACGCQLSNLLIYSWFQLISVASIYRSLRNLGTHITKWSNEINSISMFALVQCQLALQLL